MASSSYSAEEYNALFPQPELDSPLTKGRFTGKVVIVTGGNSGIGRATVERFSNDGATVAIFARDQVRGEGMERELQKLGRKVKFYKVDVTDRERCLEAAKQVADANGGSIHFLINNAGVNLAETQVSLTELPIEAFQKTLSINVIGLANTVQACFPYMKKAGPSCSVVNVGSIWGHNGVHKFGAYCTSKGAVDMLTKCMALDLAKCGIRVNSVSPGYIWTRLAHELCGSRENHTEYAKIGHMNGKLIEAAGVASVIAFLCSKDAMYIDGSDIPVDCGYNAMGPEGRGL